MCKFYGFLHKNKEIFCLCITHLYISNICVCVCIYPLSFRLQTHTTCFWYIWFSFIIILTSYSINKTIKLWTEKIQVIKPPLNFFFFYSDFSNQDLRVTICMQWIYHTLTKLNWVLPLFSWTTLQGREYPFWSSPV